LVAQGHADIGQSSHQQTLRAADVGQRLGQGSQVEAPTWLVGGLPDVDAIAAVHAEIMACILRKRKIFDARYAAIEWSIRRSHAVSDVCSIPQTGIELGAPFAKLMGLDWQSHPPPRRAAVGAAPCGRRRGDPHFAGAARRRGHHARSGREILSPDTGADWQALPAFVAFRVLDMGARRRQGRRCHRGAIGSHHRTPPRLNGRIPKPRTGAADPMRPTPMKRPRVPARRARSESPQRLSQSNQYNRMAMSKCQVRRISITSNSRASPGGNAW